MCRHPFHVNSDPLCDPAERQSGLRLDDWLPTEFTWIRDVARGTTTEACFIDVEAGALRIFDAIRERFAIGQDGSDLDRVLHLRFAAPRAVWTPTVNFLGAQGWSFFGGTSASAPMVTGTAGILEALGAGSPANLKLLPYRLRRSDRDGSTHRRSAVECILRSQVSSATESRHGRQFQ